MPPATLDSADTSAAAEEPAAELYDGAGDTRLGLLLAEAYGGAGVRKVVLLPLLVGFFMPE